MDNGVETTCDSRLEISRNHVVLWATTADGHHVLVVVPGWFMGDLSRPVLTENGYVAIELPNSEGWCDNVVEGIPPVGEFTAEFNEDGDRAEVNLEVYVNCDRTSNWRKLHVIIDAEVVWVGQQR